MAERTKIGMSLNEFMARFEEQPFELINGQIHHLPIEIKRHSLVRNELFKTLLHYEETINQLIQCLCLPRRVFTCGIIR